MGKFEADIKEAAAQYGADVSDLSVALAVEAFKDARNYPAGFDELDVLADMERNMGKITMAAVEIDSKGGVENQSAHSENGTNRTYYQGLMAYRNVIGFARCI